MRRIDLALLAVGVEVAMLAPRFREFVPQSEVMAARIWVALVATLPPMLQDAKRLQSKLWRFKFDNLMLHFDWMTGHGHSATDLRLSVAGKLLAFVLSATAFEVESRQGRKVAVAALISWYLTWCLSQFEVHRLPRLSRAPLPMNSELDLGTTDRPFVVLAYQRAGSNLLCSYLSLHPAIAMHNELFNGKAIYAHDGIINSSEEVNTRDRDPAAFLARSLSIVSRSKSLGGGTAQATGFKVFPENMCRSVASRELFERVLSDRRIAKVILRRENRVKVCVSSLRASVTGEYIHTPLDDVRVHVSPPEVQTFIESYDAYYSYVKERVGGQAGSWVELLYEDIVSDPTAATGKVYDMLGVARVPAAPEVAQRIPAQSSGSLRVALVNFEELESAFAGSDRASDFA